MTWMLINCNDWSEDEEGKKVKLIYMACGYLLRYRFFKNGTYTNNDNKTFRYFVDVFSKHLLIILRFSKEEAISRFMKKEANFTDPWIEDIENAIEDQEMYKTFEISAKNAEKKKIRIIDNQEITDNLFPLDNMFCAFIASVNTFNSHGLTSLKYKLTIKNLKKHINLESYVDNKLTLIDKKNPNMKIIIECDIPTDIPLDKIDYKKLKITKISVFVPGVREITVNITDLVSRIIPGWQEVMVG